MDRSVCWPGVGQTWLADHMRNRVAIDGRLNLIEVASTREGGHE